jgi:signal transduction histidine kinase
MDSPLNARPESQLPGGRLLAPARLLRILGVVCVVGCVFTFASIAAPHIDTTYDPEFMVVAVALGVCGTVMIWWGATREVTATVLHVGCAVVSAAILALSWLGMRDLGGIEAVFLFLILGVSATVGRMRWTVALFVFQSAGYALVLATSTDEAGFDKGSQWLVLTLGLATALVYHRMVRRQLTESAERDVMLLEEQAVQRAAHAERLEQLNRELHQANDLKSRFVAMASHELRTPLTAISGFATTMRERWSTLSDEDKQRFITIIDEQSERLGRLVGDLLMLSRIESGRLDAHVLPVPVCEVVERTAGELAMEHVTIDCDASVIALADEDYLQQILVNYLANALTYGAPPYTVTARATRGWVELVVTDEGPGVPSEFVPQLFDRFTRVPLRRSGDSPTGTGLGLSIVEGLAHAHGGTAWYEPNQPNGARFGVRLPAAREERRPAI